MTAFEDWEVIPLYEKDVIIEIGYKSIGRKPLLSCGKGRFLTSDW